MLQSQNFKNIILVQVSPENICLKCTTRQMSKQNDQKRSYAY
jgi:hypothetical protein